MSYLSKAQVDKLLAPINPNRVGKDGKGFSHVEAYEIRATMIRVFGFARWSEEVTHQELVFETEKDGKWTVLYRSIVKLTICAPDGTVLAVYTEGATGEATNQRSRGDAHDLALKTSQSQAFKRAAANIGDVAGLSLWGKGSLKPIVYSTLYYPFGDEGDSAPAVDSHIDAPQPSEDERPEPAPQVTLSQQDKVAELRAAIDSAQARGRAS